MIRLPLPIGGAETGTNDSSVAADDETASGGIGRKLVAAAVVGGAAYVLALRLRSAGEERAGASDETQTGASSISIDEPGEEDASESAPGEARSPEEIAERVGEDVDEKPAEPGEMAIDESVVEDAVDESELAEAVENEGDEESNESPEGAESNEGDQEDGA